MKKQPLVISLLAAIVIILTGCEGKIEFTVLEPGGDYTGDLDSTADIPDLDVIGDIGGLDTPDNLPLPDDTAEDLESDETASFDTEDTDICEPDCGGLECGDDGCGGSCGACDDGNPCTDDDVCDDGLCAFPPNENNCDDGNPCTDPDTCADGVCFGPLLSPEDLVDLECVCETYEDCEEIEDGDVCNGTLVCEKNAPEDALGICMVDPDSILACDDEVPCTIDSCDPQDGCLHVPDDTACDDGNICTDDACDFIDGCQHVNNNADCDDNDTCTPTDICQDGACVGTGALDCDDANVCTDDTCDPVDGCQHTNNTAICDDGNPCTITDICQDGACVDAGALDCDDSNICTDDTCDPAAGCMNTNNTAICDDENTCTISDICQNGACVGSGALDCDDSNVCTDEVCDPVEGCMHTDNNADCDDGDPCTLIDLCQGGACVGTQPDDCDDGNTCTDDGCSPFIGCANTNNTDACDDGDACTLIDVCQGGLCVGAGAMDCDDGNPCTDDACDPTSGCVYTPNSDPCDDSNICTDDTCNPAIGCVYTNNTASCDDNDACTDNDTCSSGTCSGQAITCNDSNVCTDDSCDPATGCINTSIPGCDSDCMNPVFHLDFNEFEDPLVDEVGGIEINLDNNMSIQDSTLHDAFGTALSDLSADNTLLWIDKTDVDLSLTSPWTVELWFRWESGGPILYFRQGTSPGDSKYLDVKVSGGTVMITNGSQSISHPDTISTGEWHHLAVVHDGDRHLNLYLDDIAAPGTYTASDTWPLYGYMMVGHKHYLNNNTDFSGWFDELKIYDCAKDTFCLPSCDGKQCGDDGCGGSCGTCDDGNPCTNDVCGVDGCEYLAPGPHDPEGLDAVKLFHFDGDLTDAVGSTGGTWEGGGAPAFAQGVFGQALALDGSHDVQINSTDTLNGPGPFTIDLWFSPAVDMGVDGEKGAMLYHHGGIPGSGNDDDAGVRIHETTGALCCFVYHETNCPSNYCYSCSTTTAWDANDWYHFACTFSPEDGVRVYVNGALENHDPSNNVRYAQTSGVDHIGAHYNDEYYFNGRIDEFRISDMALSPSEIGSCPAKVTGCVPDCDGKECGDDGCGGSCGTCDGGLVCHASGICYDSDWLLVPDDFAMIQEAIDNATSGATVAVVPGTYQENVTVEGKSVHILALAGPASTTITGFGTPNENIVRFIGAGADGSSIKGFSIQGHACTSDQYGATCIGAWMTDGNQPVHDILADGNILKDCYIGYLVHHDCSATVINSVLTDCNLGVWVDGGATGNIYNNTIAFGALSPVDSPCSGSSFQGLGIWTHSTAVVKNNLFHHNDKDLCGNGSFQQESNLSWSVQHIDSSCTDLYTGDAADPLFASTDDNDFRLLTGSPAIDSGLTIEAVTTDIDGITRPQGNTYDIGAYEMATCVPDCADKECGDDGCGGSCGNCEAEFECYIGHCVPPGMAYVTAGEFYMGCNTSLSSSCNDHEKPYHAVMLDGYWVDIFEVTNEEFAGFLNSNGNSCSGNECIDADDNNVQISQNGDIWQPVGGTEARPVLEVNWHGATAYCEWKEKRLCFEAEWEKAARGVDGSIYPWGDAEPTCMYAVIYNDDGDGCGTDATWDVGSKPQGASPYGALDMTGNLAEWVFDTFGSNYYSVSPYENPTGPSEGDQGVVRGGSFAFAGFDEYRTFDRIPVTKTASEGYLGFRCCKSL